MSLTMAELRNRAGMRKRCRETGFIGGLWMPVNLRWVVNYNFSLWSHLYSTAWGTRPFYFVIFYQDLLIVLFQETNVHYVL